MDQLRALRTFVQVIDDGSFAGAARTLDLTPAVVTRAVADLERRLGSRLLQRSTRRLALTEVGENYLERARQVLADLDEADFLASTASHTPIGTVRVLCPPALATHQLMPLWPRFRQQFPAIRLELQAPGAVAGADPHFDVSLVSVGQQALQGDGVARLLAHSYFVLCATPAYLAQRGSPQTPADLATHDGLVPDVAAARHELNLFAHAQQAPGAQGHRHRLDLRRHPPVLCSSQLEVLYSAALAGLGVAGLPSFMVAQALKEGHLVRVLPAWHGGALQIYASVPTRKHLPARTRAVVDFLVDSLGGRAEDPWLRPAEARPAPSAVGG